MAKIVENDYRLENGKRPMSPDEIRQALSDFEYFMGNCQQIVNKRRQLVPFRLNAFQRKLFETILPLVQKETRVDKRHNIICVKGRQVGASVSVVALINYLCAYAGLQNFNVGHVFPVGDTISKFYQQKVTPIISGVRPDIFPTITRETLSSSILTHYKDIKGIPLNNYYELVSSGSDSIRSSTLSCLLEDEVCYYKNPSKLDSAILPALPDTGFSLLIYLSTVGENASSLFFLDKLRVARDNPEDWTIVFVPWYFTYPEEPIGVDYQTLELDDYESSTILPAMAKDNVPKERWGDCIVWYRRRLHEHGNSRKNTMLEYPTTLDEVFTIGESQTFWSKEMLDKHEDTILPGHPYRILTDNRTGRPEAQQTDDSPFIIYRLPIYGHQYRIAIDPITARSEDTDNFVMHVFDTSNNEQVATFADKGLTDEDYADWAVSIGTIYNNAQLCPEINVANGFVVAVNARRYYHWWYQNKAARANHAPGLRTTVTSKEAMLDALTTMLDRKSVIIHDANTLDECRTMVKHVKHRADGTRSVSVAAKKGKHDDRVAAAWIYAGTLDVSQLSGNISNDWFIV